MVGGEEPRPQPRSLQTKEEEEQLTPGEDDQENQEDQEHVQRITEPLTAELISWSNKGGQREAGPNEGGSRHWSLWVKSSLMD